MPHNTLQKIENGTYVETEHTYDIYLFCWLTRSLFSLISLESRKNTTLLEKIKQKIPFNAFVCLKDFLQESQSICQWKKKRPKTYVAPMSKKFTSVSMSLKLSTADWLPKNRTTSPAKVEKRSANEDPLRQTTINSSDQALPPIAIISKKRAKKLSG